MDTIFYNGIIETLDRAYPRCSAAAVRQGVITALGSDEEILALREEGSELIDLKGSYMVPGFTDSHLHFLFYAEEKSCVDLSGTKSFAEAAALCKARVSEAEKKGKWLKAVSFNHNDWDVREIPARKDLDAVTKDVPFIMQRTCHHIMVCNTKALELAGLMNEKPGRTAYNMGFYEDGTPNGQVFEQTQSVVKDAMPPLSDEDVEELIREGAKDAAKQGITQLQTDDFSMFPGDLGERVIRVYRGMAERDQLDVRIYEQCMLQTPRQLQTFLDRGHHTGEGCGFFRVGPLKIVADGSLGAHTAAMMEPYLSEPRTRGILNYTDREMEELVQLAQDNGMQIAIHCIGDDALRQSVEALRKAVYKNPKPDMRHGIVHCQIMSRQQQDMFRKLNLLAYIQPIFLRCDMHIVEDCVGRDLAQSSYNWRRFADLGVHQSGGSDCPVEKFDVLPNLEYAVTRTDRSAGKTWFGENGLTAREALEAFTIEGAYASFSEQTRGTITVGKYADMTVLDRNLLEIPAAEIHSARVLLTMTGGKITYREGIL